MTDRIVLVVCALILALVLWSDYSADSPECVTDTECMAFCPPPADDPDCDGGPESFDSHL